jgi:hypothetical protein
MSGELSWSSRGAELMPSRPPTEEIGCAASSAAPPTLGIATGLALVVLSSCGGSDAGEPAAQQPTAPSASATTTTAAATPAEEPRTEAGTRASNSLTYR